jgi:hypothetical protein
MNAVKTGRRSLTRTFGIAAGGAAALLALTGCLSISADMSINADATGSGTFAINLQKQAGKLMGMTDLESFKSGLNQDTTPGAGDMIQNAKCEPSETAEDFVLTCTYSNAEFTKPDQLWTIKKANDQILFQMKNAPSAGADAGQLTDLLGGGSLGDVTVNVTFPGPIQSVTGAGATKTSDTTATVKGSMTDSYDVTITSATSSGPPIGMIIGIVIGLLLLAAIVVGLILFLVSRGKKRDAAAAAALPAQDGPAAEGAPVAAAGVVAAGAAVAAGDAAPATPDAPTEVVETVQDTVTDAPTEVVETVQETVTDAPTEVVETVQETTTTVTEGAETVTDETAAVTQDVVTQDVVPPETPPTV